MAAFFSDQQRALRYMEGAKRFAVLTEQEQALLDDILSEHIKTPDQQRDFSLQQTDTANQNYLHKNLLLKFYLNSAEFVVFMRDETLPHMAYWQQRLKDNGYPYFKITSVDGNESLSIATHFLVSYLHRFCEEHRRDNTTFPETIELAEDLACDFGSFYYLDKRCQTNLAKLKSSPDDLYAIGRFLNDARRLGNLYGTYGYVAAAIKLWDLCTYYDIPGLNDAQKTKLNGLYKITMEYFLRAIVLYENTGNAMNKKIFNHYTRGEGFKHFVKLKGEPIHIPANEFVGLSEEAANEKILAELNEKLFMKYDKELVQSLRRKAAVNVYKVEELVNFII